MAQLPCEHLKRIGTQTIFIVDQGVMSRSASTLDTLSGIEIEIVSVSQNNVGVDNSTSWNVLWFSNSVSFIFSKKPSMVHFIHRDNCETRSKIIYLVHAYYMQQVILEKLTCIPLEASWRRFELQQLQLLQFFGSHPQIRRVGRQRSLQVWPE